MIGIKTYVELANLLYYNSAEWTEMPYNRTEVSDQLQVQFKSILNLGVVYASLRANGRTTITANKGTRLLPWICFCKDLYNRSSEIPKGGSTPNRWDKQLIGIELVKLHACYGISRTHLQEQRRKSQQLLKLHLWSIVIWANAKMYFYTLRKKVQRCHSDSTSMYLTYP